MNQEQNNRSYQDIHKRLDALERSNRRYKRAMAGVVTGLLALVFIAAGPSDVQEVIKAKRLELIGQSGQPVMVAEAGGYGGMLTMKNMQQNVVVAIGAQKAGGGVMGVGNGEGLPVGLLEASESGGIITMRRPDNKVAVVAGALNQGATVAVNAPDGRTVFIAKAQTNGGEMSLYNSKGNLALSTLAVESGGGFVVLDSLGKAQATIGAGESSGVMSLFNKQETVVWQAPTTALPGQ